MHKALHPRDDINKRYVSRKDGGRERDQVEDCADASTQGLKEYVDQSK